jgi:hypothetical protein
MRAYYRAVYQQILHIRVFYEVQVHPLPDTVSLPARKSLEHAVRLAELLRKVSPRRSCPVDPDYRFYELSALGLVFDIHVAVCAKKLSYPQPFGFC